MLEQVRGLGVDLKRVFLIQQVQIEPLTALDDCITNDYH